MKLILKNGFELKLPDNLETIKTSGTGNSHDTSTSFLSKFRAHVLKGNKIGAEKQFHLFCHDYIHNTIKGEYDSYFEPLGGVGLTASIYVDGLKPKNIHLNDIDEECVRCIRNNFPVGTVITKEDGFNFPYSRTYGMIFGDFNNFTLLKYLNEYKDVTKGFFSNAEGVVLINDCSNFYLNRGQKAFETYSTLLGETVRTFDEFYSALVCFYKKEFPDWDLILVVRFYASSYLLFSKNKKPFRHVYFTASDIEKDPVARLEFEESEFLF